MDSSSYSRHHHHRRFLPLPSPSQLQLHLPPSQNNTLPPIPTIPPRRITTQDPARDQPRPPLPLTSVSRDAQHPKHESASMSRTSIDDVVPTASDFVKKLYRSVPRQHLLLDSSYMRVVRMLEDQSVHHVVSWGPHGDCFVVKVRASPFCDESRLIANRT